MKHFISLRGLAIALMLICCNAVWAYDIKVDGIYYSIKSTTDLTVVVTKGDNEYSGDIVIPSTITYKSRTLTVTSISGNAFHNCTELTSVKIPQSVTSIGYCAFYGCSSLANIEIPNSVTSIGYSAFEGCSSLASIEIPNSVTSIESSVFNKCYNLTSVTIPNSVTSIGICAFAYCKSLTSVTIPNSVTSIEEAMFLNCSGLTSVTIPNSVTSIGKSAFSGCKNLLNVEIPNGVTNIEQSAFMSGCFKSIVIPGSVTKIGYHAFYNCKALKNIYVMAETPPSCGGSFEGHYINTVLYVPNGCLEAYQNAFEWKNFWDIREFDPTGIDDVKTENENATTVYDLNGCVVENPTNGIYIINGKKVLLK